MPGREPEIPTLPVAPHFQYDRENEEQFRRSVQRALRNIAAQIGQLRTSAEQDYSVSNVTTDRAFDADSTTTAELADVLGTLINDLAANDQIGTS